MALQLRCDEYMVGWVCALPIELSAAQKMLDEKHGTPSSETLPSETWDTEIYTFGRFCEHNVVIVCLPGEQTGIYSERAVVEQMKRALTSLRFVLRIGIGGGVPSEEADIRLGDVVVGRSFKRSDEVVRYGSSNSRGFEYTGSRYIPPRVLYNAIAMMDIRHRMRRYRLGEYLSKVEGLVPALTREAAGPDLLYAAKYDHQGGATCQKCDTSYLVHREPRSQEFDVVAHYGTIASGDQVMKSAIERDELSLKLGGVLCFETNMARLEYTFPCLHIRGICDYADSHQNDRWQAYAAATGAAYAKELLSIIPRAEVAKATMVKIGMTQNYRDFKEFIEEISTKGHYDSFDSITWGWTLPAIPVSDVDSDVVLVCTSSTTHAAGEFAHVHASTYSEYLKQFKWVDFIMEILNMLSRTELHLTQGGTF